MNYTERALTLWREDGLPTRRVQCMIAIGTGLGYHVNELRPGNDMYPSVQVYVIDHVAS